MKLSERLSIVEPTRADSSLAPPTTARIEGDDPMWRFRQQISDSLYARLGARLFDSTLDQAQLGALVTREIGELVVEVGAPLSPGERQRFVREIIDDVMGLGPIEQFLADSTVSEIMVNGTNPIFVERRGKIHETDARFMNEQHLRRVIDRIVGTVGRRIDESSPMVDARLLDGSRVNAIIPPLSVDGPALTIRKFSNDKLGVHELVELGALSAQVAELLGAAVRGALTVLVSGGTGTGKTTLLNVLSSFIPDDERIVTIEDAVELQLRQKHVVRLESRPANIEGRGEIAIRDLVRNSLRMRPDRIVVGEVRGAEALDMLQAINTGHDGSLTTVHANSPRDALARLETMVMMAGFDLPLKAIRDQVCSGLDIIVQLTRFRDGTRRVTQVTEVVGMEGEIITLSDLFTFNYGDGVDANGRVRGSLVPTGIRPAFLQHLADLGITVGDGSSMEATPAEKPARKRLW